MQPKKKAFMLQSRWTYKHDLPGTIRGNEEKDGSIKITERAFLEPVHVEWSSEKPFFGLRLGQAADAEGV